MWTLYDLLNFPNGSSLIKNESSFEFSFGKKLEFHQMYEYIKKKKKIGNMNTTETFHNRPAFAKYAKMSVSLHKLRIKKSRAVAWCQRIPIH